MNYCITKLSKKIKVITLTEILQKIINFHKLAVPGIYLKLESHQTAYILFVFD